MFLKLQKFKIDNVDIKNKYKTIIIFSYFIRIVKTYDC